LSPLVLISLGLDQNFTKPGLTGRQPWILEALIAAGSVLTRWNRRAGDEQIHVNG
jgi:hypothetical protein